MKHFKIILRIRILRLSDIVVLKHNWLFYHYLLFLEGQLNTRVTESRPVFYSRAPAGGATVRLSTPQLARQLLAPCELISYATPCDCCVIFYYFSSFPANVVKRAVNTLTQDM